MIIEKPTLLYNGACGRCLYIAEMAQDCTRGKIEIASLRDTEVMAMLDDAKPGWKFRPTLVEPRPSATPPRITAGILFPFRLLMYVSPTKIFKFLFLLGKL